MNFNEFTLSLIFLSVPGILVFFLLKKTTPKVSHTNIETVLLIFLHSIFCYGILSVLKGISVNPPFFNINGFQELKDLITKPKDFNPLDILFASIIGLLLALGYSYAITHTFLNRAFHKINASRRFGDKDVWNFFNNMSIDGSINKWAEVRDHEKNLIYYGFIKAWSEEDPGKNLEILLLDVDVFKNSQKTDEIAGNSQLLYSCKSIYINQKPEFLTVEVPAVEQPEESNES